MSLRKKRILLVSLGYEFGGVEAYLNNLVQLLEGKAEFFALCFQPELVKSLRARSVRVIHMPRPPKTLKGLTFAIAALLLLPVVLYHRIDVVQINGYAEVILLLPARMLGCKAMSTRHLTLDVTGAHWYNAPGSFLARFLYKTCARFANRVICVSNVVGQQIRQFVPEEKVSVIPNWLPRIEARSAPAKTRDRSDIRILFVGRLKKHKGLQLLLTALQGVRNVELTVVGDGDLRKEYESQASSLAKVNFVGFQSSTAAFFQAADIFVMPSLGPEGLPLVSLEGMAHGLPCLFSDLPVHKEITNDGEAAMLFASGDAESLRTRLMELMRDPVRRRLFAERGYQIIQERFSPAVAQRSYAQAFGLDGEYQ